MTTQSFRLAPRYLDDSTMKISQQIENILKLVPATRDSDKELLIIYMQKSGMELTNKQIKLFKEMPSTETIRRTRQSLQEQGKYQASPEVDRARFEKFKQVRSEITDKSPEELLEARGYRVVPYEQEEWNK